MKPIRFTAKDLTDKIPIDDEDEFEPKFKPQDFEQLQAYLGAFPFKWKVRVVHDEPCGQFGRGGRPQMRVIGLLEGEGVKSGSFEITFGGRSIEVVLPPDRQAIFEKQVQQLEFKK